MNKIWLFLLAFSFIYAYFSGNFESMIGELLDVPSKTLELLLTIGGLIIFYTGIFNMAIASGVISFIGKLFKPISYFLFPKVPKESIIHEYICGNITANLLGLGLASTPIALKTIKELKKSNNNDNVATNEMITLIIINITSFTLFPLTVLTLREQYNSNIGIYIWLSLILITFITSLIALIIDRVFQRFNRWHI